ncbi:MAG: hypothetical protein ACRDLP_02465 [Solirubrobacteraceae bacterium]
MDPEGARGGICGARPAGVSLRRCVLPPGHAGSHRFATHFAEPASSALARRTRPWTRTKACPECGQRVMAAARVCGSCGWRFDTPPLQAGVAATGELSRVAITALVSGIVGIWIVAIPLGIYGRRTVERSAGRMTGRGVATIAIVLGVFDMIVTTVLAIVLAA